MNRYFLFLLGFLFCFSAAAEETVIRLQSFSKKGEKAETETVIAGKDFLLVNDEKLTPAQIIAQSEHIKKISHFVPAASVKACEAGRFEHILKKGKLEKKETGCVESGRYSELKASFKALAKDPLLDHKN